MYRHLSSVPLVLLCAFTVLGGSACAQTPNTPPTSTTPAAASAAPKLTNFEKHKPESWEKAIAAFEAADKKSPPPQNAVLFIGSSSIVKWKTLAQDFPGIATINRGFGGSYIEDSTFYADRIVIPYHPRKIVFFAGDNDLSAGRSPEGVLSDFAAFVAKVRSSLPNVPIVLLAVKPSPSRWKIHDKQVVANKLLADFCAQAKNVAFVDVYTPMLGPDGTPPADLFQPDRLHMTPKGYAIWTKLVAPYVR